MLITRARFGAITAELKAAGPLDAPGILARMECIESVTFAEASELTGLSERTLKLYDQRARKRRADRKPARPHEIPPRADGMWQVGDLAWWMANRAYPGRSTVVPARPRTRTPAQRTPRLGDEAILPAARAIMRVAAADMDATALQLRLADEGISISWRRARRIFSLIGRPVPGSLVSADEDGLVSTKALAAHHHVDVTTVARLVRGGLLTPAVREPGPTGAMRFDPAKVTAGRGRFRGPVDAS